MPLLLFALLDGLAAGFGAALYAEYALLGVVFGLVAAHGAQVAIFNTTLKRLV